ncbi:lethal(2)neighbour of Tid protein [Coccinella septempunctata]|uniref:lethal(2)neighbour of Tid protein n=1 Tax=Coccinella septempunctata TaxID=41139 RepID=UPI001D089341|nr:lethal(2)neighbour of Tid protein [Coccinella septempunctata]
MAPTKNKTTSSPKTAALSWESLRSKYLNKNFVKELIYNPRYLLPTCTLLFFFEVVLNIFIIENVRYTEIDWVAYMQEVEGFLNGTLDYSKLRGDTGPLVYPAGFVYIYSALYYLTSQGKNIYLAQYIFLVLYLLQTILNYRIHIITAKVPPYALLIATLTSYRIHSIYVLRLFNDPVAVFFFYLSMNFFLSNKWLIGSIFYSLAVSVKMNILLYAPCLLIAYLTNLTLFQTFLNLLVCALIQLMLGLPFLMHDYWAYIKGSFDLGRVFEHKWTVNYRFLPRDVFESRYFHIVLLLVHVSLLLVFLPLLKRYLSSYAKLNVITSDVKDFIKKEKQQRKGELQKRKTPEEFEKMEDKMSIIAQLFVLPFYITNFIGVALARSLHYQFYCWYFHSILYLVFCTKYKKPGMFLLLAVVEYCWNVYPSTNLSSILLHVCHVFIIYGVYKNMKP